VAVTPIFAAIFAAIVFVIMPTVIVAVATLVVVVPVAPVTMSAFPAINVEELAPADTGVSP
jgi:hypothetical protein